MVRYVPTYAHYLSITDRYTGEVVFDPWHAISDAIREGLEWGWEGHDAPVSIGDMFAEAERRMGRSGSILVEGIFAMPFRRWLDTRI